MLDSAFQGQNKISKATVSSNVCWEYFLLGKG